MGKFYGIDLGTTNSLIASVDENGDVSIIDNELGQKITPSAIKISEDGNEVVGQLAKNYAELKKYKGLSDGSLSFTSFKRHIKFTQSELKLIEEIPDKYTDKYNPIYLSSLILKKIVADSVKMEHIVENVVISVPANFSEDAKRNTLKAAGLAGLNNVNIVNEPTAAAIYYAHETDLEPGIYAVYDMGGGTFDCTFMKINGFDIEIITSEGVESLGGDDMDEVLLDMIIEEIGDKSNTDENLQYEPMPPALKIELSNSEEANLFANGASKFIFREKFEENMESIIAQANQQFELIVERLVEQDTISSYSDIKGILLAGGATRTPIVKKSLEKYNIEIFQNVNVDEIIALGAAQYAAIKSDNLNPIQVEKYENNLSEVSNKSYGEVVSNYDNSKNPPEYISSENLTVIKKDSKLPAKNTVTLYSIFEGQKSVSMKVTEAPIDTNDLTFTKILWQGNLPLPELENGYPPDRPLTATYLYDENQIHVTFIDQLSGEKINDVIDLVPEFNDDDEENTSFEDLIME